MLLAAAVFGALLLFQPVAEVAAKQKGQPGPGPGLPPPAVGPAVNPQPADEALLKAAHLGNDGPALVEFFKKRVPPTDAEKLVNDLIKQLGDKEDAVQQKAHGELVALGPAAVAGLRQAANGVEDKAVAGRARQCLQQIEGAPGANLVKAAARSLGEKKPAGAVEALLGYLPYADNEAVAQDVESALATVAVKDGKPDPFLYKALEDKQALVRAAAAEILCQVGGPGQFAKVRPLLKDEKPAVRLRAALALAAGNDGEAVPVLIDNLAELQPAQLKQAEEVLNDIAGDYAIRGPQGNDAVSKRLRRELWQTWWKGMDGKTLTDEMHARTLSDADYDKAKALIKQLGDANAEARDKASTELVAMGPGVVPMLRQVNGPVSGVQGQAAVKCIQLIEKDTPNPLPYAAPRLLVLHRADKALETLLAYLPFAENDAVASQIADLISAVGFTDGKPAPALTAALEDKVAARRAAAVIALGQHDGDDLKATIRKMLKDPDVEVRLRASQALIGLKDKEAVPELINLFTELPPELAWEAEDTLGRMAGAKTPTVSFAADAASRTKVKEAWTAWWKENADKVELVRIDQRQRLLGYTLIIEGFDPAKRLGRVVELDAGGKVRWQIEGLNFPTDAVVVGNDRVLIAEQNMNRVTERDLTGKIIWEKQGVAQPFAVQRARNGNTFIGCRNQLFVVDRDGKKDVLTLPRFNEYIIGATMFRDGQIAYFNNQGMYYRFDAAGKEQKNVRFPFNPNIGINWAEILPSDHVLITTLGNGKVTEYDGDGKQVWEATIQPSAGPTRMPNGHTLVPTNNNTRIVELDRTGKQVGELKDINYRAVRVTRR
jgi:HEAT repeat protein